MGEEHTLTEAELIKLQCFIWDELQRYKQNMVEMEKHYQDLEAADRLVNGMCQLRGLPFHK